MPRFAFLDIDSVATRCSTLEARGTAGFHGIAFFLSLSTAIAS